VVAYSWWGNDVPYHTNLSPVMHTALSLVMKSSVQPEDLSGGQQEVEDQLVRELGPTPQL